MSDDDDKDCKEKTKDIAKIYGVAITVNLCLAGIAALQTGGTATALLAAAAGLQTTALVIQFGTASATGAKGVFTCCCDGEGDTERLDKTILFFKRVKLFISSILLCVACYGFYHLFANWGDGDFGTNFATLFLLVITLAGLCFQARGDYKGMEKAKEEVDV